MNLLEIFYRSLSEYSMREASEILHKFSKYLIEFELGDIEGSMKLRFGLKKDKGLDMSYADAMGYFLAKKLGFKFLTGDPIFAKLSNVEFVK
jgi:predicted nucleic acid-binding protein